VNFSPVAFLLTNTPSLLVRRLSQMVVRRSMELHSKHGLVHRNRHFRSRMKLYKVDDDSSIIVVEPDMGEPPLASSLVSEDLKHSHSATESSIIYFHNVGLKSVKVEATLKLEMGELVSKKATFQCLTECLEDFRKSAFDLVCMLGTSEMTEEDGRFLGEELMNAVKKGSKKEEALNSVIAKCKTLEKLVEQHSFMKPLLDAVVENKLHAVSRIDGKAENLGDTEGRAIGRSLAISLATTLFATIGVDEWILQFPALQEVDKEHSWFRPMVENISYILVGEVGWGLKARVAIGATMSIGDLSTDIFVAFMYWDEKRKAYFQAIVLMLGISCILQLLIIYTNNSRRGLKITFLESLPVLCGLKPAVDAYRVAHGDKAENGQTFDPQTEMSYIKGVELFAESIPGIIIQIAAIATTSDRTTISRGAWISLVMSAMSTGFIGSSISYDYDTDPTKRKQTPEFYGFGEWGVGSLLG
jgi:hypothetical protein